MSRIWPFKHLLRKIGNNIAFVGIFHLVKKSGFCKTVTLVISAYVKDCSDRKQKKLEEWNST